MLFLTSFLLSALFKKSEERNTLSPRKKVYCCNPKKIVENLVRIQRTELTLRAEHLIYHTTSPTNQWRAERSTGLLYRSWLELMWTRWTDDRSRAGVEWPEEPVPLSQRNHIREKCKKKADSCARCVRMCVGFQYLPFSTVIFKNNLFNASSISLRREQSYRNSS